MSQSPVSIPRLFSTCPPSNKADPNAYAQLVVETARWSEEAGCEGILVYTDNGLVDPWLVAQLIIENTEQIAPLVAVQPVYMHPYAVAKMISTATLLHKRRMWINLVAGGFRNDLTALGDETEHDRRYDRLVEYGTIINRLLQSDRPVSLEGDFYTVRNLRLEPPVPADLRPGVTMSGSSEAGLSAARALGAVGIQYPRRHSDYAEGSVADDGPVGIRVGIIARASEDEAWLHARQRFPTDRKGQIAHQLAMKVSDSEWHRQLSALSDEIGEDSPYWLVPFENYKTFCPYLVGSYDTVADELAGYLRLGYGTFITDVPAGPEEMEHIGIAFRQAVERNS